MIDVAANDVLVERITQDNPNMLVPWYLMASYAYYERDVSLLSDNVFDMMCFLLLEHLDCINIDHPHMHLCDMQALEAGTGFDLGDKYPSIVVSTAERFIRGEFPCQ